ncbi:hypothetical protein R2F25_17240 [Streptomyces sp. UP1A-1]|nr:hypothetical protein [Streptomyces sp. UP1A-1]
MVTLAVAVAGAALTFVKVPYSVSGGYLVRDGGQVELILAPSADRSVIRESATVRLYRAGVAARTEIGRAVVAGDDGTDTTAPLSVFLPVRTDTLPAPAVSYPLTVITPPENRVGVAQMDAGTRSVGAWLYARYVAPAWRW